MLFIINYLILINCRWMPLFLIGQLALKGVPPIKKVAPFYEILSACEKIILRFT